MIIRSIMVRHGRRALAKHLIPFSSPRRLLATEVERIANPFAAAQIPVARSDWATQPPIADTTSEASEDQLPSDEEQLANNQVVSDWEFFKHQKAVTSVGGVQEPHYRPHQLLSNPPWPKDITLELLMASQSHLGHRTSLWHPANAKYIFGIRGEQDPIHIISLDVTAAHLRRACKIVRGVTERAGLVLFVGSREGQAQCVVKAAQMAQGCHLFAKWIPGSITNGQQILGKCAKKVVNEFDEEVPGFQAQLFQKAALKPDLVVCLNPLENYVLLHECGLNHIPTIGIIDTDANPTWVTYPIPANDDSLRCVQVIAGVLGRAGQEGQEIRAEKARAGVLDYTFDHGLQLPDKDDAAVSQQDPEAAQAELDAAEDYMHGDDIGIGAQSEQHDASDDASDMSGVDPSLVNDQRVSESSETMKSYESTRPLVEGP